MSVNMNISIGDIIQLIISCIMMYSVILTYFIRRDVKDNEIIDSYIKRSGLNSPWMVEDIKWLIHNLSRGVKIYTDNSHIHTEKGFKILYKRKYIKIYIRDKNESDYLKIKKKCLKTVLNQYILTRSEDYSNVISSLEFNENILPLLKAAILKYTVHVVKIDEINGDKKCGSKN